MWDSLKHVVSKCNSKFLCIFIELRLIKSV
jgi:hypothetical protein